MGNLAEENAKDLQGQGWQGTTTDGTGTMLFSGGEFLSSKTSKWIDVLDPSTQAVLTRVPEPTADEMEAVVQKSHEAWLEWKSTSVMKKQRVLFNLVEEIRKATPALAQSIVLEQGKTLDDAKGDVLRGLQVVENSCGIPKLLMGDKLEVAKDMDTYVRREPLGVGAAICPFNFPAMIPLWNIVSIAAGNSLIVKPSEQDPGATMIIAELCVKAGMPPGVFSVIHGSKDTVNFLCDHPLIKAVSFVGSNAAGKHIHDRALLTGKRVQANMGAKNHAILMPDANKNSAINAILGAAFGAAGQRCMALSVLVTVGTGDWIPELVERAKSLKYGNGFEDDVDLGPVISPQAKDKIHMLIGKGGKVLLDGRNPKAPAGYPNGNWVGPTVIEVYPGQEAYDTEIFGPVLCIVERPNLDEAIKLINSNCYGNGAGIFTQNGAAARKFEVECEAGQLGINVPIPVPLPMFSWSGNKASVLGGHSLYGDLGLNFWLQNKTITSLWKASDALQSKANTAMPTQQ